MKKNTKGSATDFYGTLPKTAKNRPKSIFNHGVHLFIRVMLWSYICVVRMTKCFFTQRPLPPTGPIEILITGTFFSENWITSLLRPMALSKRCGRIRMVSTTIVPNIENVEPIYPPKLLSKIIGRTPARLTTFCWIGFRYRPQIIGGLHLLVNGLVAILLAKLTRARSLYSCCGGPTECAGGGYNSENHLFGRLHSPDPVIERFLLEAISATDLVVTRGSSAIRFFQKHGVQTQFHAIPGGMDGKKFSPANAVKDYDLITMGNLVPRKRVDIFLEIIRKVRTVHPDIKAVILGDGPLKESLKNKAKALNLKDSVHFAGHQSQVDVWLKRAKIFVLTSESEGLSQAMIQAMLSGIPAVVSLVGEAEELVKDGKNGFLVQDLSADTFAKHIVRLLKQPDMLSDFSKSARQSAEKCEVYNLARKWDNIFRDLSN